MNASDSFRSAAFRAESRKRLSKRAAPRAHWAEHTARPNLISRPEWWVNKEKSAEKSSRCAVRSTLHHFSLRLIITRLPSSADEETIFNVQMFLFHLPEIHCSFPCSRRRENINIWCAFSRDPRQAIMSARRSRLAKGMSKTALLTIHKQKRNFFWTTFFSERNRRFSRGFRPIYEPS